MSGCFYLPLEEKALMMKEVINIYAGEQIQSRNLLLHAELPEIWPALIDVVTDNKIRLWVATIPESKKLTYQWWVLQDTGELIATFRWPGNRSIEKIKDGYVYARETEESTWI